MNQADGKKLDGVYMGNVGSIYDTPPLLIRRSLMKQLLFRDHIVFSDSQILTDPAIHALMGGQENADKELQLHFSFPNERPAWVNLQGMGLKKEQKDFERLLKAGLVKVAHRSKEGRRRTLNDTWNAMLHYPKPVPHLPLATSQYSVYLDSILQSCEQPEFDISAIAAQFRENLLSGISFRADEERKQILNPESAVERQLADMFQDKDVLFSSIKNYMDSQLKREDGSLSKERHDELENYVNSCYSCNIPILLDCRICTEAKKLPLHLDCGTGDFQASPEALNKCELKSTFALNDELLDYLPTDAFVELCKKLHSRYSFRHIQRYFDGVLQENEVDDFAEAWEDYAQQLEDCIINYALQEEVEAVQRLINTEYLRPRQETLLGGQVPGGMATIEIVNNVLERIPAIGAMYNAASSAESFLTTLNSQNIWGSLKLRYQEADLLLKKCNRQYDTLANIARGATVVETKIHSPSEA